MQGMPQKPGGIFGNARTYHNLYTHIYDVYKKLARVSICKGGLY